MNKIDARKHNRTQLLERRQEVVALFLAGMPVMQIVATTGLSWSAVNVAIKRHQEGVQLEPAARGKKPKSGRFISEEQEKLIYKLICTRRPWQTGIKDRFLWDRESVQTLIQQKCAISLTPRCIAFYLARWGLVASNKKKNVADRRLLAIRKWLKEHFASLNRRAHTERGIIYWVSKTRVPMTDIEYQFQPEAQENSFDCNKPEWKPKKRWMISATNSQGRIYWLIINSVYNEEHQLKFLKALVQNNRKKVFLIREDLKTYTRSHVLSWLRVHQERIELFPDPDDTLPK